MKLLCIKSVDAASRENYDGYCPILSAINLCNNKSRFNSKMKKKQQQKKNCVIDRTLTITLSVFS